MLLHLASRKIARSRARSPRIPARARARAEAPPLHGAPRAPRMCTAPLRGPLRAPPRPCDSNAPARAAPARPWIQSAALRPSPAACREEFGLRPVQVFDEDHRGLVVHQILEESDPGVVQALAGDECMSPATSSPSVNPRISRAPSRRRRSSGESLSSRTKCSFKISPRGQ